MTREAVRGRYRINPDRSVDVWDGTRYVPRTSATIAPEAAGLLQPERAELTRLSDASIQGDRFLALNRHQATGSAIRRIPILKDIGEMLFPDLQEMENIQNSRVFDYMRGGAAGGGISPTVANTPQEQGRLERTGPTISNTGPVNRSIVLSTQIERDLQARRITEMERWARDPQRRSLEGFEQWWTTNAPGIRSSIQRAYESTNGPIGRRQENTPPQRPRSVPPDYVWDAERERWRPLNAR
jgi:hypothetical protein